MFFRKLFAFKYGLVRNNRGGNDVRRIDVEDDLGRNDVGRIEAEDDLGGNDVEDDVGGIDVEDVLGGNDVGGIDVENDLGGNDVEDDVGGIDVDGDLGGNDDVGGIDVENYLGGSQRRLEGKVAVITGGAAGIGEATARLFVRHGAKVIIADIADESGRKLCETLGPSAAFVHCDVSKEADMSAAVDMAVEMHGHLDIMYNNAGIMDWRSGLQASELDMEEYGKVMSVNLGGTMLGIKHAARVMIPRKKGSIVCTASVAGIMGGLGSYAYTASEHAIVALVEIAAAELRRHGIRVNCVSPYAVATAMTVRFFKRLQFQEIDEENEEAEGEGEEDEEKLTMEEYVNGLANLKGTTLKAEDVADCGLFLASDEARCMSGHNLVVDGGFTVVNHCWQFYT